MKIDILIPMLNLQLFAEGGAGGAAGGTAGDGGTAQGQGVMAGAASQQTKGVKSNPFANVKFGIQDDAPAAEVQPTTEVQPDLNAEYRNLIKGKYKAQHDAYMQDTIQKRLKGTNEIVEKFNALTPTLETLAKKHGVDANDIAALNKAIEEDDYYFEQDALEMGMTVEQYKEFRKVKSENAELRRQMQEQENQQKANKLYAAWMNQAEEIKKVYPSFDFRTEMNNPRFIDLLHSNVDVRTAYEVLHKDEIIPAAMQFTAKTVESKLAKKIAANGSRPAENGMSSGSPAVVKSDVSQLTRAERDEIRRQVAQGARIRF